MFEPWQYLVIGLTGLLAGTLGGMLGVGGSVIMIPALVFLFGQGTRAGFHQHLYQAAAMIVNVAVVAPAFIRHRRAGAVLFPALWRMLPAALVCIVLGVLVSDLFKGQGGPLWLGRILAAFLVYVIYVNIQRLISGRTETHGDARITWPRALTVGAVMGFIAGLLGIGGGAIAVPLQQIILRLPLRNCIANSTAVIMITAGLGAVIKNATLAQHQASYQHALLLAALLAPTAIIGGYIGGALTHRLPLRIVRIAFIALMTIAAWKMAGL